MFQFQSFEILTAGESAKGIVASQFRDAGSENEHENLPTLLVVDDERLIADTLSEILRGSGFAVTTAYDGHEALKIVRNARPDYLLTDVLMPKMNGVDLAIAVRNMHSATRILLFSGNVGVSTVLEQGRRQGHEFSVLGKPVHPTALLKRLRELK
jgi:CheY-like chemotaxis protein